MKTSEADILIVPGWQDSGPEHWQSRWEKSLPTARRVVQDDWQKPEREAWTSRIAAAAAESARPVIFVGHSLGVAAIIAASDKLAGLNIAGAFLVAPADVDHAHQWPDTGGERWPPSSGDGGFATMPENAFAFPSILIVSSNDAYCALPRGQFLAEKWGASFVDAGENGHINIASGHGPWPEGLFVFGGFLRGL